MNVVFVLLFATCLAAPFIVLAEQLRQWWRQ